MQYVAPVFLDYVYVIFIEKIIYVIRVIMACLNDWNGINREIADEASK